MENIWTPEKLSLFLIFFVPGFVSMKVWELTVATERRDFQRLIVDGICYSALNFAALSWLIMIVRSNGWAEVHPISYVLAMALIIFIMPALWPSIWLFMWRKFFHVALLDPTATAWDFAFGQRQGCWLIVHLVDGRKIGGKFSIRSFASAFPQKRDIFVEELWSLDEKGGFKERIDGSAGLFVRSEEISMVEFFSWDSDGDKGR